ncbi:hypothetical protein OsccyDRAFT_0715 [Leptolyngbyaceae cyanobacterium JSC-12]|nr:hypothetical protein OsccyDRAFT_0715 [Leptolyngbyaceae cyanobacterium JSC-12]
MDLPYVWFIQKDSSKNENSEESEQFYYGYLLSNNQTETIIITENGSFIRLNPYQQGALWGIHPIYQVRAEL